MMDDNGLKTIGRGTRDNYIDWHWQLQRSAKEPMKPLSKLDIDELGVHLEEMKETAALIDSLPKKRPWMMLSKRKKHLLAR